MKKRRYTMQARAEAVRTTQRRILEAAIRLFGERYFDEITLDELAREARTTVQTVIRHFETKEGVVDAATAELTPEVEAQRMAARPGDLAGAIANLAAHYEEWAPRVLHMLAQEGRVPAFQRLTDGGRALHRAWVRRTLGPLLGGVRGAAARRRRLGALVAATDVYAWKVLRQDVGLSPRETEAAIRETVAGICGRRE